MRKRLFASFHLLLGTVCSIAVCAAPGCTLDTQPQVVSDGLGTLMCTALNLCDGGVPSGASGIGGNSGAIAVGTAGFTASGTGVTGTAGVAGTHVPVAGITGTGGASATGGTPVIVAGTGGMTAPPDAGPPPPTLSIGDSCTDDALCISGHCDGVCCSAGDCCTTVADCKPTTANGIQVACNSATTCQGSGGTIQCTSSRCMAIGGAPDDSACDAKTKASDCGFYQPVYCNGTADQSTPMCPMSCQTNADCLPFIAHCDQICKPNIVNGQRCTQDLDCGSKHCGNGFCCGGGDCCNTAANCPASYSAAPTCDTKATCQGTQKVAVCGNYQCGSSVSADDEACTTSVLANDCGSAMDQYCKGGRDQQAPKCGGACTNTAQCDPGNYCASGSCQPKLTTPMSCTSNDMCTSGFCAKSNNRCCSDTNLECCVTAADCTDTPTTMTCDDPTMCKGTINGAVCQGGLCQASKTASSDPCTGKVTMCGVYLPAMAACPAVCKKSCTSAADCMAPLVCTANACVPMVVPMAGTSGSAGGAAPDAGPSIPSPASSTSRAAAMRGG